MNVPVPNANIALWIAVARTSGSSESARSRSLCSRPASAVTECVPYVDFCANFIEHGTGPRLRSRPVISACARVPSRGEPGEVRPGEQDGERHQSDDEKHADGERAENESHEHARRQSIRPSFAAESGEDAGATQDRNCGRDQD